VEDKTNFPTSRDQTLATAFTYNSANPVAGGSTCRLPKETCVETSNSASVEVTIASPMNVFARTCMRRRPLPRTTVTSMSLRVSSCRKGKRRHLYTLTNSPRSKRRHVTQGGISSDERELDDSNDEAKIIVDATRRVPYRRLCLIPMQT
jgi:hypothetical protein